jgi:hypothetical protein
MKRLMNIKDVRPILDFAPALHTSAGSAVSCYTGGRNSKPSDKDTPWADKERRIKVERMERVCLVSHLA